MQRLLRLLAALAALSLLAAACGDDDTGSDETGSDETGPDTEAAPATFRVTLTNVSDGFAIAASGAQAVPVGADEPGPALPDGAYEFTVPRAATRVSFATMFVQSNDWFWAPAPEGLPLVDADGMPVSGDVTDRISLWDAGTEVDQTPGEGPDQAPRQAGPDTGADDPDSSVRPVAGFAAGDYLSVTLTPADDGSTVVRIDNVSGDATVPGPIAPVAWVVHDETVTFFTPGGDAPEGLEELAEDGDPSALVDAFAAVTGTTTPFAPVAWAVAGTPGVLVDDGAAASAGLESLAEDGDPSGLVEELAATGATVGAAANPDGGAEAGPALPGSAYEFEVTAEQGALLSLASMFVQSNDWFVAVHDLALFDPAGEPISGDVTDRLAFHDAGTEIDQPLGAGPDQAPRQAGPDTGADDPSASVRGVDLDPRGYVMLTVEPVG